MAARKMALYVLYGIPCVGKSTTAIEFAYRRNIRTVVNTDYIREVQRCYVAPDQEPALAKVTHNAWELYGRATRSNIEAGFVDHVNAVTPAIQAVAKKLVTDGFDAVIEGAHFYGQVVKTLSVRNANADVRATLLIVRNGDDLRQRIDTKESARVSGAPKKHWRENLRAMLTIQDFLIVDARKHGIPVATPDEWRSSWAPVAYTDYSTSITSS